MSATQGREQILRLLFFYSNQSVYAIVDGASADGLLEKLEKTDSQYCCLFSGDLSPELAQAAPYLIQLKKDSAITEWLVDSWGEHYGIYAVAPDTVEFDAVRKHFRTFLLVKGPDQQQIFFRYYDPRVFRTFLPTCDTKQSRYLFGPMNSYIIEGPENTEMNRYWCNQDRVEYQRLL